jgi:hypothetical protein
VQRSGQALAEHRFVSQILAIDKKADVVVVGDLNDYQFSPALSVLKTGTSDGTGTTTLTDLITTLPQDEQYTYSLRLARRRPIRGRRGSGIEVASDHPGVTGPPYGVSLAFTAIVQALRHADTPNLSSADGRLYRIGDHRLGVAVPGSGQRRSAVPARL